MFTSSPLPLIPCLSDFFFLSLNLCVSLVFLRWVPSSFVSRLILRTLSLCPFYRRHQTNGRRLRPSAHFSILNKAKILVRNPFFFFSPSSSPPHLCTARHARQRNSQTLKLTPVVFPVCWLAIRRSPQACKRSDPKSPGGNKRVEDGEDRRREKVKEEDETEKQKVYPDSFYFWRNKRQGTCYDCCRDIRWS